MLSLWCCGNWAAWHKLHSGDELLVWGKNHSIPAQLLPKAFLYRNPSLFPSSSCHVPPQTHNRCARPKPWLSAFLAQALLTLQKRGKRDVNYTPDWRPESTLASPLTADALIQTGHDCCWSGRVEGAGRSWGLRGPGAGCTSGPCLKLFNFYVCSIYLFVLFTQCLSVFKCVGVQVQKPNNQM